MTATLSTHRRRRHHAARVSRRRRQRRHQGQRQPRSGAARRPTRRRRPPPSSRPTRCRRRRSSCRTSTWRARAASRARSSSTAAAPTPAPATPGCATRATMAAETARLVGCPVEQVLVASTGVIGVALPMDKVRSGLPAAFAALGADQGPAAARAIMTTDPFPKEAAARISIGGREASHRRHGQGLRHDRADDGDDARLRDDRCGGAEGAARPRAARGGRRHVQRDHRRRRVLDQRLRDAARQRRQRRRPSTTRATARSSTG